MRLYDYAMKFIFHEYFISYDNSYIIKPYILKNIDLIGRAWAFRWAHEFSRNFHAPLSMNSIKISWIEDLEALDHSNLKIRHIYFGMNFHGYTIKNLCIRRILGSL